MSHAYHLDESEDHASYPILGTEGRSSSSSISSRNHTDQSTDGVFAVANSGAENGLTSSSSSSSSSSSAAPVSLNLKTLTGQVMSIQLPSFEGRTVLQLKQAFEAAHGIPAPLQRWIWAGREVNDSMTSAECRFENGCTVHLLLRQNPVGPIAAPVAAPVAGGAPPAYPGVYPNGGFAMPGLEVAQLEGGMAAQQNIAPDRVMEMQRAFQLARALRIFAIIDAIVLLLWSLSLPPLAIGVVLCLFGYFGATNVKLPYMALYIIYLVLAIAFRIFLVVFAGDMLGRILFVVLTIIEVWVLRLAIQFVRYIKSFTEQERAELTFMIRPYARPMGGQYV